ncbi:hypothetical protein AaE_000029 [Aphanomyces astaci]|uniref:Uncharacterized protein n=1 Tax=Aphanomyces astaci TaxID=112090 RepID=A0A6A5ALR9_APHAT|nr:hypothetical protein AaE_000029 [Aphanomyces astaci]
MHSTSAWMKFTRTTTSVTTDAVPTAAWKCFQTFVLAVGVIVVLGASGLLLVIASGVVNFLPSTDRALYIELCLQSVNLVLTVAAVATQVPRIRTFVHVSRYLATSTFDQEQGDGDQQRAEAIRAAFPALVVEFHDQTNPSGVNIPLRKLWFLLALLNAQCMFQYPTAIVLWFVASPNRPYVLVATCVALSAFCSIVAFVWESRLVRHCTRYRVQRAESAYEKYLVEDTAV